KPMNTNLLLPHRFKVIGWWILIPAFGLGVLHSITEFEAEWLHARVFAFWSDNLFAQGHFFQRYETNITATIIGVVLVLGGLLVGFSREKVEDEYIANLRLTSLMWAVWVNYLLLLVALLFIWGLPFLTVMVYNMFTVLVIFIVRFNILLHRQP